MIDALFFLVGVLFGAFGVFFCKNTHKEVNELEYLPIMPQGDRQGDTLDTFIRETWKKKPEEGAVVMPDRAEVIKRDDLTIDDLLQ